MMRIIAVVVSVSLYFPTVAVALTAAPSPTMSILNQEAAKNSAGARKIEKVHSDSREEFDGIGSIRIMKPAGYVSVEETEFNGSPKVKAPLAKVPAADEEAGPSRDEDIKTGDSHHFKASSPFPGMNIYTPVKDKPGEENRTEKPSAGGWRKWLKPALLGGGILAAVAGFFFPPLLFVGGFLLGAAATYHFLGG